MNDNPIDIQNQQIPIESVLYGKFIRYEDLDRVITDRIFKDMKNPEFNIYIDMYQMTISAYRYHKIVNPLSIASCLLNMAIHYRYYLRNRFHMDSHVFIFYSPTMSSTNLRFCDYYNKKYIDRIRNNRAVHDVIVNNIKIMELMTKYMRNIYFRTGSVEVSVMINEQIERFKKNNYYPINIIATNSQYAFQLPDIQDNTYLLVNKRNKENGDYSYLVSSDNCISSYVEETRHNTISEDKIAPHGSLSTIMTLMGIPQRTIPALFNYEESLKIALNMNSFVDVLYNLPRTVELVKNKKMDENTISDRFHCIDIGYQTMMYLYLPESKTRSYLQQLEDDKTLNTINEQYFSNNPIALYKL